MLAQHSRCPGWSLRFTAIILAILPTVLLAQTQSTLKTAKQPDSTQMAAVMANGMRMMRPAEMVLDYALDLALTPDQVTRLKSIAASQTDSVAARQTRMQQTAVQRATSAGSSALSSAMMTWTGPVDDEALKTAMCEQSKLSAEMTIGMIHDRHAVGEILTAEQRAKLPMLQTRDMMKGMARP